MKHKGIKFFLEVVRIVATAIVSALTALSQIN